MGKNNVSSLLTSLDDLFTTQEERDAEKRETVVDIPLSEISDFPKHPFKVKMDEAMAEMADSIRRYGVLVPGMVRPKPDGGYEMIAGHRRKMASELAQKETMPCLVRDLSDDEAIIIMVDSNLQRETLLPSEKAFAYKMKLEAMFGEEGRIKLPSPYAQVAKAMMDLEDSEKKRLLSKAKIQYALFAKMHPCDIPNGYRREQSRVISERIHELLYDKGRQGYQFFGPDTPYQIRAVLKQYLLETSMKATPRIGFLMYLSFETELALDYFISEDFTKYTSCYYYTDDGTTEIEIDDSEVRSYIGICASLPPEQRQLLMGEAIGINLGKSF